MKSGQACSIYRLICCCMCMCALIFDFSVSANEGKILIAPPQTAHEVWIGLRVDDRRGTGTANDPFDASSVEKLNNLFTEFATEYGENLTIHIGPGVFYGDRLIRPLSNWKFRGAGRDITIFRTRADPIAFRTVGIRSDDPGLHGVEVSDLTFDFNIQNLRKANRVFVYSEGAELVVAYYYVKSLNRWDPKTSYDRGLESAVFFNGNEYIATAASQGQQPAQGKFWSVLRWCEPERLPPWEEGKSYEVGDAVALGNKGYIRVGNHTTGSPLEDAVDWRYIKTDAADPRIYTNAVFVHGSAPNGNHRVHRAKAVNGFGSCFFRKEAFLFGLGGNDCTIEDCQVTDFQGDYASLIVVFNGQNNVVRNCSVRGNGGLCTMAYGGWGVYDTTFENNYCSNVSFANNIDSLTSHNVTYRGNTFLHCHRGGILINVTGIKIRSMPEKYKLEINGRIMNTATSKLDGLFIYDNLIEVTNECPFGGIQVQSDGLSNVKISDNIIRTSDGNGNGNGRCAIGVAGKACNVQITNNTCDHNMYCDISPPAFGWGNVDLQGEPIKGLEKLINRLRK